MTNSLNEGRTVKFLLQSIFTDFRHLGGSEILQEEFLHLSSQLLVLLCHRLASLNRQKFVIEVNGFHRSHSGEISFSLLLTMCFGNLLVLTVLRVFSLGNRSSAEAVRDVGHDDKHEEHAEGQVSFPLFDDAVYEHNVEPSLWVC